jgi:hypothetical protein
VVARRQHVHARGQELASTAGIHADSTRRVLTIGDHEIQILGTAQRRQGPYDATPPDLPDHITEECESHAAA